MPSGGKRENAGRPKGIGPYGETTKPMRIPVSRLSEVKELLNHKNNIVILPLFSSKVAAGLPSPADEHIESHVDLNALLVKNSDSTFVSV